MAEWLGHQTQDPKVWGSIPTVIHVFKCWANFSFHAAPVDPVVMGTWWNINTLNCDWHMLMKSTEFSPEKMRQYKSVFQYQGCNCIHVQSAELTGISGL